MTDHKKWAQSMAVYDDVVGGDRRLLMVNPREIKKDWRTTTSMWWGKYCMRDDELSDLFVDLMIMENVQKFWSYWESRPHSSSIEWSFPIHDPTALTILAYEGDPRNVRIYLIFERATDTFGIDESGSLYLLRPWISRLPTRSPRAFFVSQAHVPMSFSVEEGQSIASLDVGAERVSAALQSLVKTASRVPR